MPLRKMRTEQTLDVSSGRETPKELIDFLSKQESDQEELEGCIDELSDQVENCLGDGDFDELRRTLTVINNTMKGLLKKLSVSRKEIKGYLDYSPQTNGLPVPDKKNPPLSVAAPALPEKGWAKEIKPKAKTKPANNEQYFQTLVGFCRTHLQIEASEKQFQTEMREFLNREVPELKNNPIREETAINFSILGSADGKSTSAYFSWTQDGVSDDKTMGIARYLNKTGIADIPR